MSRLREVGMHTVCVSPFAERHSAWHFNIGFNEIYNTGRSGQERADEVCPVALEWLERNHNREDWFMHLNFWDPHTPYRTPEEYGNPFADDPPPDWLTEDLRQQHYESYGPHSAQEPWGYEPYSEPGRYPRVPENIGSMEDYRKWIDGYDVGIRYVDDHVGLILDKLESQGILDDTAIIVSADHGENQGELNVYGDHQTADNITCRIPLVVKWPGMDAGTVQDGLCYNVDLAATVTEMCGGKIHEAWDGQAFSGALSGEVWEGRESLVVSQCAWACQRGVRFGPWILIRTYHDGLKAFPDVMLFNLDEDPHETRDLSHEHPEVVNEGLAILERWQADNLASSTSGEDPLWTVMHEGGPLHTRSSIEQYNKRLRETGRGHHAATIENKHGSKNR
jgi:arylsulfatase A-like enzyme